jgi:SPP1 gp7 family putative phage head morphogenesis protein
MNVLTTKKHVKKLYGRVYKVIKKELGEILAELTEEIYEEAKALGFDGDIRDLDEGWVEDYFAEYHPATKYVFKKELSRKEARLFEALVADAAGKIQSYQTAEKLLRNQVKVNSILLEDAVQKIVYKGAGVKKVKWIAEQDHKTCGICGELDGRIFFLDDAPIKPHPNCRCYFVPIKQ